MNRSSRKHWRKASNEESSKVVSEVVDVRDNLAEEVREMLADVSPTDTNVASADAVIDAREGNLVDVADDVTDGESDNAIDDDLKVEVEVQDEVDGENHVRVEGSLLSDVQAKPSSETGSRVASEASTDVLIIDLPRRRRIASADLVIEEVLRERSERSLRRKIVDGYYQLVGTSIGVDAISARHGRRPRF